MIIKAKYLFIAAVILLLAGMLLPLLMVAGILGNALILSFAAYISSTVGLITGIMGSVLYVADKRKDR